MLLTHWTYWLLWAKYAFRAGIPFPFPISGQFTPAIDYRKRRTATQPVHTGFKQLFLGKKVGFVRPRSSTFF
jgi:hypothetical protein